jgi:ABC-type Fe3+ transport system permease subunit
MDQQPIAYQQTNAYDYNYKQQPQQPQPYAQQPQYTQAPVVYQQASSDAYYDTAKANSEEQTAMLLTILGFFFGGIIMWIVVWVMYKSSISEGARKWAKLSGILAAVFGGFAVLSFVISIVIVIIYVIVIAVAVTHQ